MGTPDDLHGDWFAKVRNSFFSYTCSAGILGLAGGVAGVGAALLMSPVGVAAGILAAAYGWRAASNGQIKAARQDLYKHLGDVLRQARHYYLEVDQASHRGSLVEEQLDTLGRTVSERVKAATVRMSEQARAEHARLVKAAKLDEQQYGTGPSADARSTTAISARR